MAADVVPLQGATILDGAISPRGDLDFFRLQPNLSGAADVVIPASASPHVAVYVADSSGHLLFHAIPNGSVIVGKVPVQASHDAFVVVAGLGGGVGHYNVGVVPLPLVPDSGDVTEHEPNDTPATANPFALGADGRVVLSGVISPGSDIDHFVLTAPRSGRVTLTPKASMGAIRVDVLDATEKDMLTIYSDRPNFITMFTATAGSRYFIRVSSTNGATADYSVQVAES
jgi:hypothetical protein